MVELVRKAAILLTALALAAAAALLAWQSTWIVPTTRSPEESFAHGSMGVAIMPTKAFLTLPIVVPDRFQPGGEGAGDWIDQFGFIRDDAGGVLPLGFMESNHLPRSGDPAPIPFVGFSCALCHSAVLERPDGTKTPPLLGVGTKSLDLFAWIEALQGAIRDDRVTVAALDRAHRDHFGGPFTTVERLAIANWLSAARADLEDAATRYDDPLPTGVLRDSSAVPNGPGRTQAFRELARLILARPAADDRAYSKLPSVFRQSDREWAQYDGSVRDPVLRSVSASLAAGATVESLSRPEVAEDVRGSVAYVNELAGPRFQDVFPGVAIDADRAARGRVVYAKYCASCHGSPDGSRWAPGARHGEIVTPEEIGTDPERLRMRHYDDLAEALFRVIPEWSPFRVLRSDIRPGPAGTTRGFINAPIEAAFTRAPYLHNGSVPTLSQLVNLEPRPDVFYRGRNAYDPVGVGLEAPRDPDARHYFRFDARSPGNSNRGHDYPWPYRGPGWNEPDLRDLLEYLKTL
jgi:hypothetical protein